MTSDRETSCKITSDDLKKQNHQKTRSYPNCAPKPVWIWLKLDNSSMPFSHRMERRINLYAENTRYLRDEKENCAERVDRKRCTIRPCLGHKSLQNTRKIHGLKLKFHLYSKIKQLLGLELWTRLKSTSERQCRSKKKKELRGNPLQRRDQYWNRHQQAIGTLFRWNRETGSTLKWKDPRTLVASRCQHSLLNCFDTRKLVEKKMPEFLMIEFLRNARKFYKRIHDISQTK